MWQGPDLARARKLIAESGTRGMPVGVWTWIMESARRASAYLLDELGCRATLHVLPDDRYWNTVGDSRTRAQLVFQGWLPDYPSSGTCFTPLLTCDGFSPADGPGTLNYAEYCSPSFDRLVAAAQDAERIDPGRARQLWARIDRRAIDEALWLPVVNFELVAFTPTRLGNYQATPGFGPLVSQMWVR